MHNTQDTWAQIDLDVNWNKKGTQDKNIEASSLSYGLHYHATNSQ